MYFLAICTSSFENSLFNSSAYFFIGMLILWGMRVLFVVVVPLSDE
jgi:hypothetical protein